MDLEDAIAEVNKTVQRLRSLRSPKIDQFRKMLPSQFTSNLLAWVAHPDLLAAAQQIDISDEKQHDTLYACMQSVSDELDARIPPRSKI